MPRVSSGSAEPSKASKEQTCKFGTIVQALWPTKPALRLSQKLGCTERAAQFYIDGDRKPSARAIAVIVNEMLD